MTVEEIKESVSMRDVLSKYGITVNRSGMCSCPFHKDRKPSMKVFKDGFKCFSCNRGGDVFSFIQNIENCDFKTAFIHLGGNYQSNENKVAKRLIQAKFEQQKNQREQTKQAEKDFRILLEKTIYLCNKLIASNLVMSDAWVDGHNNLQWLEHVWNEKYINEEEVNEIDVIRVCRKIRCKYDSFQ